MRFAYISIREGDLVFAGRIINYLVGGRLDISLIQHHVSKGVVCLHIDLASFEFFSHAADGQQASRLAGIYVGHMLGDVLDHDRLPQTVFALD